MTKNKSTNKNHFWRNLIALTFGSFIVVSAIITFAATGSLTGYYYQAIAEAEDIMDHNHVEQNHSYLTHHIQVGNDSYQILGDIGTPLKANDKIYITGNINKAAKTIIANKIYKRSVVKTAGGIRDINDDSWDVALFFLQPNDVPEKPFTAEYIANIISREMGNGIKAMSYEQQTMTFNNLGWSDIGIPSSTLCKNDLDIPEVDAHIANQIKKNNLNLLQYDNILIITHCADRFKANGVSTVGTRHYPYNNRSYPLAETKINFGYQSFQRFDHPQEFTWISDGMTIVEHELGHAIGLRHAWQMECDDKAIDYEANCEKYEYGNIYNAMGSAEYARQFHGPDKFKLGWIKDNEILRIKGTGTYTINSLNNKDSKIKFAYIYGPNKTSIDYFVEYRFNQGASDPDRSLVRTKLINNMMGIFIYKYIDGIPHLIDADPIDDTNWIGPDGQRVALLRERNNRGNLTVTDPATNITIGPVKSAGNNEAVFTVTYPDLEICNEQPPSISGVLANYKLDLNTYSRFNSYVFLRNNSSPTCQTGKLLVKSAKITELPTHTLDVRSGAGPQNVNPGKESTFNLLIYSNRIIPSGTYTLELEIEDTTTGQIGNDSIQIKL